MIKRANSISVAIVITAYAYATGINHTVTAAESPVAFGGNIVLGSPTATSIKANILTTGQSGSVFIEYGTTSHTYIMQSDTSTLQAGAPLVLTINNLSANTQYYYRLNFQANGTSSYSQGDEYRFHTARVSGSAFTFTIQADSHMDEESDIDLYHQTLSNVLADTPDFHLDLGDTFMCEKHSLPMSAVVQMAPDQSTVDTRYVYERANFGRLGHSVPLFLINGNHEGEAGWLNDGTASNIAIWTTQARQKYFMNPVPDGFYSGDATMEPRVGKRASWYAWQWGDAQFIVLDPYWNSQNQASTDAWNMTLGATQYQWLQATLAASQATYKFVFIHNLVGGLDGQMRGGIEAAPFFEWGGKTLTGMDVFAQQRPGWAMPIHQLLVKHGVTAVFHGHDHLYAKQELDGVIYQDVPQPSAKNSQSGPGLAQDYHYASGTILSSSGHLRVAVDSNHITTSYVRAWLPASETAQRKNGQLEDVWSVGANGWPTAAFSFIPSAPSGGQTVVFIDASTGGPTSWSWDFGDGATSPQQSPEHIYPTAGTYNVSLTASNAIGSHVTTHSVTVNPTVNPAFTFTPAAPTTNQTISFTDTSSGTPTTWSWSFGDGQKSALQHPSHAYGTGGIYTVTLKASNSTGSKSVKHEVTVISAASTSAFTGNIVLGRPTTTSITANIFSPDQSGMIYIAYGTTAGSYNTQTTASQLQAATPIELQLDGLSADTKYYYQLYFLATGTTSYSHSDEYTFHTARAAGSVFTFCLQGDSHPERVNTEFNSELYKRTLLTAAADQPDFYLTIGDDFSVDTLDPATVTAAQVIERYTIQRPYLGLIGRTAPVFLVNGNHEQAARYLLDGTPDNVAVWAQNARNTHYSQPAPDGFYTGNSEVIPYIGLLRNHYAWTWGDALFVVIDPYWASAGCVDNPFNGGAKRANLWDITHGDAQYQWLKTTLEQSSAKYKFVFAHHVMGTGRGGVELAKSYEWGGNNNNGTWGFATTRPSWASPIHQLMMANNVSIFFQGHDHIWVHQQLNGVNYQTLPEPADPNYSLFNADAFITGTQLPNTGYTRVTVTPAYAQVDYVRTYLAAAEGSGKVNGTTADSYIISPAGTAAIDSVGDGIPDWWRAAYFGGGGKSTSAVSRATDDPDHDGVDNYHEYLANTVPTNSLSCFNITSISSFPGFSVHYRSSIGRNYTLYYTSDLTTGVWTPVPAQTQIPGTGGLDTLTDSSPEVSRRFYRVGVQLP